MLATTTRFFFNPKVGAAARRWSHRRPLDLTRAVVKAEDVGTVGQHLRALLVEAAPHHLDDDLALFDRRGAAQPPPCKSQGSKVSVVGQGYGSGHTLVKL